MINGGTINDSRINGFDAADEAVYQMWLRNPSAAVGHIVHLGYNGTSAVYPNWVAYTLKMSDFPLAGYRGVIKSLPSFSRAISDDLSGPVAESIGELVLDNTTGELDSWHNLAMDGQAGRVYQGDPAWLAERFRTLYEFVAEGASSITAEQTSINVRGIEHGADVPLQTTLIPTAVGANAPSNHVVPKAYGRVFNARPAYLDEVNQVLQWNDGAVTSVTDGRDDGMPFRTNQIAISAVTAATDTLSTAAAHGFVKNTRVRCDIGTLPSSALWVALAWNGSVFCALAYGTATAATSPDGITWTTRTLPVSGNWRSIAWNGSVFCAIEGGPSTVALTSPDGITWTARTLPASANWYMIKWNGTVFCAIANVSTAAATSPDGITWTAQTTPSASNWQSMAYGGGVFLIVAYNSANAATSPDGITWTARTMSANSFWISVAWNGSVFCAVTDSTTAAATSPDGITWTARTMSSADAWRAITWNGSVFCAVAYATAIATTSPDGITWTARTLPASSTWNVMCWNGYVFCAIGGGSNLVTTSSDGITWSATTNTLPAPLAINTDYWVLADGWTTTAFKLTATYNGTTAINITGTDTGALLVGHHWTADLATGKIYLDSKPSGVFTMDGVAGSTAAATILPTVLNAINVDSAAQTKFAATCAQSIGIYVSARRNRLEVADDILSGLGAYYCYSRHSFLKFGRIESSYTAHDFEIIADQMDADSFSIESMIQPAKRHRIGYRKNWTNQAGALVDGISTENRNLYSTDHSASAPQLGLDEGPAGQEFHKLALMPDVIESMMSYGYDAQTEAARRNTMFYGWGAIYKCTVGRVGSEMDPGHVVKVTHSRFGCAAGVRMALVAVNDRPSDDKWDLRFFAALAAYLPGQL